MSVNLESLRRTCKQLIDSLLGNGSRHTLCLNISEPAFSADDYAAECVKEKAGMDPERHDEPSASDFREILGNISSKTVVVSFDDLDKHPKCIDVLAEHVRNEKPGGKLIVVSRHWNSDNTAKERELRKLCLFYQQSAPAKRKGD